MHKDIFLNNKKTIFALTLAAAIILSAIIYTQTIAQTPKYKAKCCIAAPKAATSAEQYVIVPFGTGSGEADCDKNSVSTAAYCANGIKSAEIISSGNAAQTTLIWNDEGNLVPIAVRNGRSTDICLIGCNPAKQACKLPLEEAEGSGETIQAAVGACNANLNKKSASVVRFMTVGEHDPTTSLYNRRLFGNGGRE